MLQKVFVQVKIKKPIFCTLVLIPRGQYYLVPKCELISRSYGRGVYLTMTYKILLYLLIQPKIILSVLVCRIPIVVYTYKTSELETLLWNNGENL
jgi:hypothetical protein